MQSVEAGYKNSGFRPPMSWIWSELVVFCICVVVFCISELGGEVDSSAARESGERSLSLDEEVMDR